MTKDKNLNEMLDADDITDNEHEDAQTMVKKSEVVEEVAAEPQAAEAPVPDNPAWVNLYEYINANGDKLENAAITNISGFTRVPNGKYLLFCTRVDQDADLILFDRPSSLWVERAIQPQSIKVENSGLIIKSNNSRLYVGKNNVTKVILENGHVRSMETVSRAKSSGAVKVSPEEVSVQQADVETIKLHVKRISPRLYNVVKDMTTREEIKHGIEEFMGKIYDLNHLIKIEKELLLALSL
jgi:hypothetical protein